MGSAASEVLTLLRDRGPMSRAELARSIGISAAALTKITATLLARGEVVEREEAAASQLGRPPVNIALNSDSHYMVGAHLGVGRVELIVTDLLLQAKGASGFDFDPRSTSATNLIERAGREINRLIDASGLYRSKFRGVGISLPGAVDRAGRRVLFSSFPDWHEVAFADQIEEVVGLPAVIEHNATAIALSEARFGVGRDSDTILHIYMRAGVGAGLAHSAAVSRSPLHRGQVEIGHVVVDPSGAPCHCGGQGCFETIFSERPILRQMGLDTVPREGLIAAAMRNPLVWEPLYEQFVQSVATSVTLLAPDLIVLGGHLAEAPDSLFEGLRRDIPMRVMPRQSLKLRFERTSLGTDAVAKGAACVGLEKFIYGDCGP